MNLKVTVDAYIIVNASLRKFDLGWCSFKVFAIMCQSFISFISIILKLLKRTWCQRFDKVSLMVAV